MTSETQFSVEVGAEDLVEMVKKFALSLESNLVCSWFVGNGPDSSAMVLARRSSLALASSRRFTPSGQGISK